MLNAILATDSTASSSIVIVFLGLHYIGDFYFQSKKMKVMIGFMQVLTEHVD